MTPTTIWNRNFVLMLVAHCCMTLSYMMLMPTLPLYLERLDQPQNIIGLMAGLFAVTSMLVRPYVGNKLDTGSKKLIYFTGQIFCLISIAAYPFVHSMPVMFAVRLLHGVGIGITTTAATTIVTDFIPKPKMGEGLGYFSFGFVFSSALGPWFGLNLMDHFGALGLFLVTAGIVATGAAIALSVGYVKREIDPDKLVKKGTRLRFSSLFEPSAIIPAVVVLLGGTAFHLSSSFIAIYAEEKQVENIGLFFVIFAFTLMISRPLSGRIADRVSYTAVVVPSIFCLAATLVTLYFASALWHFLLAAAFLSVGFGSSQNAMQTMAVREVPANRKGAAVSTYFIGADLSILLSTSSGGFVAKHFGYDMMFLLTLVPVTCALLIYMIAIVWRKKKTAVHQPAASNDV